MPKKVSGVTVESVAVGEEPATQEVPVEGRGVLDFNNIPGKLKAQLIMSGEVDVDRFIAPPNIPGKKLEALRKEHRSRVLKSIGRIESKEAASIVDKFQVGDIILFNKVACEIKEINKERKSVKVLKKNGELSKWIHVDKVKIPKTQIKDED